MRPNILSVTALYAVLLMLGCISASAQPKQTVCEVGSIKFTCPEDFEKLPNVDPTTSLFKFQYKDIVLYFFVANPSGKFERDAVMNAIAGYYPGGSALPFRWKEIKDSLHMSMRTQQEKEVDSWLGYDGTHLINMKSSKFKLDGKNVVFGYAWDWGPKVSGKQDKFKKADDLGDQAIGCNTVASTLNSLTKEFPQYRQYCFSTSTN